MTTFKQYFNETIDAPEPLPTFKTVNRPQTFEDVDSYKDALIKLPYFQDPKNQKTLDRIQRKESSVSSGDTQMAITIGTYRKVHEYLKTLGIQPDNILDYGAGLGMGATEFGTHSFEPNAKEWEPTYNDINQIKGPYDGLISLNVLNVLPLGIRDAAVAKMGEVLSEDGIGIIQTRRAKGDVNLAHPFISFGDGGIMALGRQGLQYQKGFSKPELVQFVSDILLGFDVKPFSGINGVIISRKASNE